ncbi:MULTISPECIES: hypothetical protein [Streptomycetaceae]|uniref:Uncharacterized protein n=1 Tax=Streptantibioticus cattleyicolor (strain ATCC 35852 / DSM 46488 / JCM 4925 / NBRC 14057 / NRRL 8057) TaxID=1003195 RepID=F8JT38_STREN|nr:MULTISPECIES: hypothetical protein [Streptomycetaceae]AEW92973.1 hypothetical protein SCATT_06020 [Streptantibioticus cattleyicolor NRRL 8057 = DSM 46488]MYS57716.1 hypothetical protein [Streptomyces sp. SID5468]CCB73334.1 protein of unknown function [Streptantibioticus cattleyicolor NRRL 8057 = DSM 46488]
MAATVYCPYCYQPVRTTENGLTSTHDYPYDRAYFGQCKGSGQRPLTGPGTPPAAWGASSGKTWVDLGVLPSPFPHAERDGWTVTITGLRFTHSAACWSCRQPVYVATDGGTIRLGFDHKGRSFEEERPGRRAAYKGPCPNGCGEQVTIGADNRWPQRQLPVADARIAQYIQWYRLRRDLGVTTVDMTPADMARLRSRIS